ncbi:MAG: TatD family hydrolase [Saprospiraceae bacterium]|nr:TatD family hydrolase [Saprospiraceae bacterium]
MTPPYIDFHTHKALHKNSSEVLEIISMHDDCKDAEVLHTLGHHPWWTHQLLTSNQLTGIKDYILRNDRCIALGECGLDKLKGPPMSIQEQIFIQQLAIANEAGVPVVVHCVRQYDLLLSLRRQYGSTPWVVHGFRRNKQLAKALLDQGIYLSVSPFARLNPTFQEMLQYLPLDYFFLETDSEYSHTIGERYEIMAVLRKMDIFALKAQLLKNCATFYLWRNHHFTG